MMMTEMDIETSVYYVHLTRLIALEDYIKNCNFAICAVWVRNLLSHFEEHGLRVFWEQSVEEDICTLR
jgi:hypothetical protein